MAIAFVRAFAVLAEFTLPSAITLAKRPGNTHVLDASAMRPTSLNADRGVAGPPDPAEGAVALRLLADPVAGAAVGASLDVAVCPSPAFKALTLPSLQAGAVVGALVGAEMDAAILASVKPGT